MKFIQTGCFTYKDYAICGGRGWICPNEFKFTEDDKKIYDREAIRIEISLKEAKKAGYEKIIVITHYPPTNDSLDLSLIHIQMCIRDRAILALGILAIIIFMYIYKKRQKRKVDENGKK